MKVRVAILGTVGKSVLIDTAPVDALTVRVDAIEAIINAGIGSAIQHSSLLGLQVGDDHPQYTMWAAAETIAAPWNFNVEPFVFGESLTEFIQDTVGVLVADTSSITWNYADYSASDGFLFGHVREEFVQDVIGASLTNTASITLSYNDPAGRITANAVDEYFEDLIASKLCDSESIVFDHYDTSGCITAEVLINNTLDFTTYGIGVNEAFPFIWSVPHIFSAVGSVSANTLQLSSSFPMLRITETDAAVDAGNWQFFANGGALVLRAISDNNSSASSILNIARSGVTITGITIGNGIANASVTFAGTGTAIHGGRVRLKNFTVATLPAGTQGDVAYVTDALAPTFGTAVVGGGAVVIPVFYDGTNWVSF